MSHVTELDSRYFDVPRQWPGPVTRKRLRRFRLSYGAVAGAGFALSVLAPSDHWRAFGLGLVLPGGGFLHYLAGDFWAVTEHLALAAVSAGAFAVAVVVWWWCGIVLLPIIVWVGTAALAATMHHDAVLDTSWLIVAALVVAIIAAETYRKHRVARQIDGRVQLHAARASRAPMLAARPAEQRDELSLADLSALRFALDRALQPVEQFNGFHFGDQWQLSATRYQIFTLGWALALANANYLPAMRGYLQDAQLNLLEKTRDPRLWSYWKWENLWGNFRLGADPLIHDNIMYSGYVGKQLGLYQAATGDLRHDAPGAYTLVSRRGRRYVYDVPTLIEILVSQYESAPFGAWPCEPNWIYLFCNTTGGVAIRAYDAAHGTAHWDRVAERFDRHIAQEFTRLDGTITELRSAYTGLTPPFTNGPATTMNAAIGLHPLCRERAEGLWWLSRDDVVEQLESGESKLKQNEPAFDPGNMKRSPGFKFGMLLHGAREFGDDDLARAICAAIETELTSCSEAKVLSYHDVSVWGHALLLMGRVGRKDGLHDLATLGSDPSNRTGPVLRNVHYPDVLVARAFGDGAALDTVLYPGRDAGRHHLELAQLRPGARYRCVGALTDVITANQDGTATIAITVEGRTPLTVVPQT
ncbi:hypothetical protein JF781_20640 [Mycobacterium sp. WUMAC-067]|uniref:linalool dehydratase/isomerase domain-containing protein n=1 Tax=unclassified Mycobacterium TaxID=2642494 RepID=UPI001CDA4371|nr:MULTISPECIES: hypothetical protein [unclassified Mycobacterium]MCA2244770.1 hypothetical protein [Mycobacterium sp. WUMAC-067]MCA2315980.1 hypothetical protein [Mycobacterium sp. WUMAC-025]